MRRRDRLILAATLAATAIIGFGPSVLQAQQAVANNGVNVREGHSRATHILDQLDPGDTVDLLSPNKERGYYHVRERDGTTGWVYGRNLTLLGEASPTLGSGSALADSAPAVAEVDSTWRKPAPLSAVFHRAGFAACGAGGQGGDTPTNFRKNRIDEPAGYHAVTFDAITSLPFPRNHKPQRTTWNQEELDTIAPYEGVAVTVTAFIARQRGIIVEDSANSSNGESTNCHARDDAGVDWHVTLVLHTGDPKSAGIVVETTPRVRANGHPWTPHMLAGAIANGDSVRISGWLMYDPEHFSQTANYDPARPSHAPPVRATLWEVHPVTRIEVFNQQSGHWRQLP